MGKEAKEFTFMISIRLIRTGRKNQPSYRMVAQEQTKAPKGAYRELLGSWSPLTKQRTIKKDRVAHWLSVGAQPTDTVWNMLVSEGVIKAAKRPVHKKSKKEAGKTAPAPAAVQAKPAQSKAPANADDKG